MAPLTAYERLLKYVAKAQPAHVHAPIEAAANSAPSPPTNSVSHGPIITWKTTLAIFLVVIGVVLLACAIGHCFKWIRAKWSGRKKVVDVECATPAVVFIPPVLTMPPPAATQFLGLSAYSGGGGGYMSQADILSGKSRIRRDIFF
ncbi:hypothetical protein DFH09DRAFT_1281227 [Mycena vulgaris]|nr:hypothetical protein DFH09DRAFT_1281227 [Mycena vulgaris]